MKVNSAVILAGGMGRRLQNVVQDVPKPMAPINGRPFLEYLLDYWIDQNINHFILSVGYKYEVIERHFTNNYRQAKIEYAVEEKPLGTGGGLLYALKYLDGPESFIIINGDTFFEVDLESLCHYHQAKQALVTIALRKVEANSRYSRVEIDGDGKITTFDNHVRTSATEWINGGVLAVLHRDNNGASGLNRTDCLRVTNPAHRQQCFRGIKNFFLEHNEHDDSGVRYLYFLHQMLVFDYDNLDIRNKDFLVYYFHCCRQYGQLVTQ